MVNLFGNFKKIFNEIFGDDKKTSAPRRRHRKWPPSTKRRHHTPHPKPHGSHRASDFGIVSDNPAKYVKPGDIYFVNTYRVLDWKNKDESKHWHPSFLHGISRIEGTCSFRIGSNNYKKEARDPKNDDYLWIKKVKWWKGKIIKKDFYFSLVYLTPVIYYRILDNNKWKGTILKEDLPERYHSNYGKRK